MIEAHGLTRRYGGFTAVTDISFQVDEGEIVGILGPNGAGKTTTIRMITGFLPPSEGRVTVSGLDLFDAPKKARRQIGYLPENVALYPEMRVREYLAFRARLEGLGRTETRQAIGETIERALLEDVEWQIIGTLSKGYRQRVGLAAAILHQPGVLVLDEPTVGLDPKQIIAIRELIRELGARRTLLLSTHILPEVEQLCDRVLIIDRGRLVAEGTPAELRQQSRGASRLHVTLASDGTANGSGAEEIFARVDGVAAVQLAEGAPQGETRFVLDCAEGADARAAVFRAAVDGGLTLLELAEQKISLEDVFVRLTRRDQPAEAAMPEEPDAVDDKTVDEETVDDKTVDDKAEEAAS